MGGGKGSIDHYIYPVRAGRMIIELGGKCEFAEVKGFLSNLAGLLPFPARAVSREMLEKEQEEEQRKIKENVNPFTFEYCVKNNIFGCKISLSKYDQIWHGKYRWFLYNLNKKNINILLSMIFIVFFFYVSSLYFSCYCKQKKKKKKSPRMHYYQTRALLVFYQNTDSGASWEVPFLLPTMNYLH